MTTGTTPFPPPPPANTAADAVAYAAKLQGKEEGFELGNRQRKGTTFNIVAGTILASFIAFLIGWALISHVSDVDNEGDQTRYDLQVNANEDLRQQTQIDEINERLDETDPRPDPAALCVANGMEYSDVVGGCYVDPSTLSLPVEPASLPPGVIPVDEQMCEAGGWKWTQDPGWATGVCTPA